MTDKSDDRVGHLNNFFFLGGGGLGVEVSSVDRHISRPSRANRSALQISNL